MAQAQPIPQVDLVRQEIIRSASTVVVKVGTNVLSRADGTLDREHIVHLADQIADWRQAGCKIVLVSSGAIGAGLGRLGLKQRPTSLPHLQAAAAVGQSALVEAYDHAFARHGYHAAQILLNNDDLGHRTRYLNVSTSGFGDLRSTN